MKRNASLLGLALTSTLVCTALAQYSQIGSERAIAYHLGDDSVYQLELPELIEHGKALFSANWTDQDGAGRPFTKGNGAGIVDRTRPLRGLLTFNRISGPDANSCAGCHRLPFNAPGGSGDVVAQVQQGAERFDFLTFDRNDSRTNRGSVDEHGRHVSLRTVGNSRIPPDLLGAGYLEMIAREITVDLRRIRDTLAPGQTKPLVSKGISFGTLTRRENGGWYTQAISGLPPQSLLYSATSPPSLLVRPWRQSGTSPSLREITNSSYNQHLGIQTTERFGAGTDLDGDGVVNEMTRGDVTAAVIFQATLPAPGRVIPNDPLVERAILTGEVTFEKIGCGSCHIPSLGLTPAGWIYAEPGPFNPTGSLRQSQARVVSVDLTNPLLPQPRLAPAQDARMIYVPAYTDFKLHDITDPADDTAQEALDLNQPPDSKRFIAGNRRFLTRRLWGVGNQPPYWHDGRFTTMREAVLAHAGEAIEARRAFQSLPKPGQDELIEFLKSLQALPPETRSLVVDENFQPKAWTRAQRGTSSGS